MPRTRVVLLSAALLCVVARPTFAGRSNARVAVQQRTPRLEVAFVLDSTGSMGPYINEAKTRIEAIASDLAAGTPKPDVQFALVTYRDRGDDYVTKVGTFDSLVSVMKSALAATRASGGGDHPEAALEGLAGAIRELHWSSTDDDVMKLIYLIGDAPAKDYSDTPNARQIAAMARRKNIVIHSIVCGGGRLPKFGLLARLTEGRTYRLSNAVANRHSRTSSKASGIIDSTLEKAVSGSAKAYSSAVGVSYESAAVAGIDVDVAELSVPVVDTSGLIGAQVRWVRDSATWQDLWAAHTSLLPASDRPGVPAVDFSSSQVLVLGGADSAVALEGVREDDGFRIVKLRNSTRTGVSFHVVPRGGSK